MVKNIWDSKVEVEESNYYWKEKPIIKPGKKINNPNIV